MGQASRDFGAEFEKPVRKRLKQLEEAEVLGYVQKNQPTWALQGKGPPPDFEPRYVRVGASGADFAGFLGRASSRPGLAFGLEVKSIGPKPPKSGKGMQSLIREVRMPEDQIKHLDALAAAGAVSLLLVQWRCVDAPWFVSLMPWAEVPWRVATKNAHLDLEAARAFRTGVGRPSLSDSFFTDGVRSLPVKTS